MNTIGISALYHDSACALIQDGVLTHALQEERLSRDKNDPTLPHMALRWILESSKLSLSDIDCIAFYEDSKKKLSRQLWSGLVDSNNQHEHKPDKVERMIREQLGYDGEFMFFDHHLSHAASAYYFSGFEDAAILTVDGVGEWDTTTYGDAKGDKISLFDAVHFPDSLGLLYSTFTTYLGFQANEGEYKVMGLAPYGKPEYVDKIQKVISSGEDGAYQLNMEYFDFLKGERMYSDKFLELFETPVRKKGEEFKPYHADIAKSLQVVLEEILLSKANYLYDKTGSKNLCMAGGVALNCVANGKILRDGPFEQLFVQPAAGDAGGSLGAAALAYLKLTGERTQKKKLEHVYLGPEYSNDDIGKIIKATSLKVHDHSNNEDELIDEVARRIAEGKVIGWFHGRVEFGPRALGARSILADPRDEEMKDKINAMVKKREGFRPFAPAVLEEKYGEHFDLDHTSPFMLETCQVKSSLDLPAITHVDGSARVQTVNDENNPRFAKLLRRFDEITGCPIVLNTSFNVKGEPIVCSPEDAISCFIGTQIDCLVLENFIIDRSENNLDILAFLLKFRDPEKKKQSSIRRDVYTFI